MIKLYGIMATDGTNRYNHKITFKAFYDNYLKQWNDYIPFYVNHDHTKPVGCSKLEGFYIKPGTVYVMNSFLIGENREEDEKIAQYCVSCFYDSQIEENKKSFELLKEKIKKFLSPDYKVVFNGGAYIFDKGIVEKVFSKLCSQICEGLINLNELNPIAPGVYKIDDLIICAHPYFRRSFSRLNSLNEPFLEKLQSFRNSDVKVQIAIDIDFIGLASSYVKTFEYQYWWGPKFSDDLSQIQYGTTVHINENYNSLLFPIKQTEFRWYEQGDMRTFECEEILDTPNISESAEELYGCRFVHSMVDNKTNRPIHLDGAVRAYTMEKMCERLETNIDKTGRDTIYTKIWRMDNLLSIIDWKELITHYYRDNMIIGEYFGGTDKKIVEIRGEEHKEKQTASELKSYIPFQFPQSEIFNFSISFQDKQEPAKGYNTQIIPLQSMLIDGKWIGIIDNMAIPIIKLLKKDSVNIQLMDMGYVECNDYIHNFPHFLCFNNMVAQHVLAAIKTFIKAWKNNANELISFTIEYPENDKNIRISFIGQKSSLIKYLECQEFKLLPSNENQLYCWANNLYEYLTLTHKEKDRIDPLAIFKDGYLYYDRKSVPKEKLARYECDDKGIRVLLKLSQEEIKFLTSKNISVAPLKWYKKVRCSKCHSDYFTCNCVQFIDDKIICEIEDFQIINCVWADNNITALK